MNAYQEVVQNRGKGWGPVATRARASTQNRPTITIDRALQPSPSVEYENQMDEAASHRAAALREIRRSFVLRNDAAVARFLQDHRIIPRLLLEALSHVNKHFGSQTVFDVKTLTDEDGSRELCVIAMWSGNARKAMEALDNFHESWWIEKSRAAGGRINFTYELDKCRSAPSSGPGFLKLLRSWKAPGRTISTHGDWPGILIVFHFARTRLRALRSYLRTGYAQ